MGAVKILIVEDELIIAHSLLEALQNDGYQVVGMVDTAASTMATISKTHPDIILMDIFLQGESDGIALAQEIQKVWDIPIIYLTAHSDRELIQRAKITNPYGYILKPYRFQELKIAIEMSLNRYDHEQQQQSFFQEEINKVQKVKREFLTNIKHEFRTPMNVIQGFSQLLQSEIKDQRLNIYLSSIIESGDLLMKLLEDMIELAQIESADISLNFTSLDIRNLLWEIETIFSQKILNQNLTFVNEIDERVPKLIRLDERCLKKILLNLIDNSLKFTNKGSITISVQSREISQPDVIELRIAVQDTGIGISKKNQSRLFDLFYQADSSLTRSYGGIGLGLTLAQKLAEYLGGKIEVESEENRGSIFTLIFPKMQVSQAADWLNFVSLHQTNYPQNISNSSSTNSILSLNPNLNSEILSELLARLRLEEEIKWPQIKTKLIFSELTDFALDIYQLGQDYPYPPLQIYAEKLLQQISVFDTDISYTIEAFPSLVQDLENFLQG
jgi:two-component system sensor histidine kinase EvgS